jgi:hypothetical protein
VFVPNIPVQQNLIFAILATAYQDRAPLHSNIKPGWKGLPGTKALAYLASLSVMKKNVLTLTTGVNVIKHYFFSH